MVEWHSLSCVKSNNVNGMHQKWLKIESVEHLNNGCGWTSDRVNILMNSLIKDNKIV